MFVNNFYKLTSTLIVGACLSVGLFTTPAQAAGPGVGSPTVVTVGDSYISGEAGRWAGNSPTPAKVDALGAKAYFDNATKTGENIPGCHRSASAPVHFSGVKSVNLACSGARTVTSATAGSYTPGIDFYADTRGRRGQAVLLRDVARVNNVKMVAVSIGGNDFGFGDTVRTCATNFVMSALFPAELCSRDAKVVAKISATNRAAVKTRIVAALRNVRTAMRQAGYKDGTYKVLVLTYPSPIPNSGGFRYTSTVSTRYNTGGCPFFNSDADWANSVLLPAINATVVQSATESGLVNISRLDVSSAFNGHRLCEKTSGRVEEKNLPSWKTPGGVAKLEWVGQIRQPNTKPPYLSSESLHPNFFGQLALRSCLAQAYNGGYPRGGVCLPTSGFSGVTPNMRLY